MKNKDLKYRIFEIYAQNLKWLEKNKALKFKQEVVDKVVCPLCLRIFARDDLKANSEKNHLTLEHNPPEYFSGKPRILTCKECNNTSGHNLDIELQKLFEEVAIKNFLPNAKLKTKFTTDLGAKVSVFLEIDNYGKFLLNIPPKNSSPQNLELFERSIKKEISLNNGQWISNNRIDFTFEINKITNFQKATVALLKIAYLYAFDKLGHIFLFNHSLDVIRNQIKDPNSDLIGFPIVIDKVFDRKELGHLSIVRFGNDIDFYLVSLDLTNQSLGHQFNVILPGFYKDKKNIYENLWRFMKENHGQTFYPKILHLDNKIDIKKESHSFLAYEIWSKIYK